MSRGKVPPAVPSGDPPGDDIGCPILHVDMDAFYASVEIRKRPELHGRKVIVGGANGRGVVLSATYEARRDGVHAAMSMGRALRLCPEAIVVRPDFSAYSATSKGVFALFNEVTPLVQGLSLDEAFLDVRGAVRRLGRPREIGELLRARIHDEQGITCSVGVAPTKFLAKLASGRAKPDGLLVVPADGIHAFLRPLPVGALWGVGERTERVLVELGLRTVADVADIPVARLRQALGPAAGTHLSALARGLDEREVEPGEPDKSIGAEQTFGTDIGDPAQIRLELLRLSDRVARRMRAQHWAGRTVSLKVRYPDFTTITRARTLGEPTDVAQQIYATAVALYEALDLRGAQLRLVGVRVEGLSPAGLVPHQLALGEKERGWREAEMATDRAVGRFGAGSVRPASLVPQRRRGGPEGTTR